MKKNTLGRKKTIVGSLIIGLLIVGSSFTVWAVTINKGIILAAPEKVPVHAPAIVVLNGDYIDFKYSDSYKLETMPANASDVESYYLTANTNYEKHLAVAVHRLDAAGLNGFTGYTSRNARTDVYDKQEIIVGQEPALEFTKKDLTEKTIFIPHGNDVALFSFVTTSRFDDIDTEITAILNSFMWKQ